MLCKLCNLPVLNIQDKRNNWEFFHCQKCEFIFKNSLDFVSDEDELKQYNNHNNTMDSPGYVEMFEKFMSNTFEEHIDDVQTALEFGSGPGPVLSELLKRRGLKVDIYDKYFSPNKVYEGKKYDLITSTEVIEHIENPLEIFEFFSEHVKSGGYLALMTQFHTNVPEEFKKWWYKNDPTHICFFRPRTFEVLAQKSGFKILKNDSKKSILLQRI
ncbi:class I SAM-dependent methyltransferase [Sulfurimonas sp.]|uniref:class I SAM-dependent methyltransferase n=1 Tax=Sulfurimonas sp. TaxID=2022749 RepID=UPI00356918F5